MKGTSRYLRLLALSAALCGIFLMASCSTLPSNPEKIQSRVLEPASDGLLRETSEDVLNEGPDGASAFLLLEGNEEALQWRLALIDHAQTSIDLQYFIWTADEAGRLLFDHVAKAAARGVRVRILVDDFPLSGHDTTFAALDRESKLHIRVFNPPLVRSGLFGPALDFLINFGELNRRMHNKLMLVDGHWAIVGGRNIGNPYFGLSKKYNFRDMDVLVTGPVIDELEVAFDDYWNSDPAYPGYAMQKTVSARQKQKLLAEAKEQMEKDRIVLEKSPYPIAVTNWQESLAELPEMMTFGDAVYMQDHPIVRGDRGTRLLDALRSAGNAANDELVLITPYMIPPPSVLNNLESLTTNGVDVTILTASMAANNHTMAHSHYKKYRKRILSKGVNLYEAHDQPSHDLRMLSDTPPVDGDFIALHIKATIEDREFVYLGSLNADPRALKINTENVMVIRSPELAEEMLEIADSMLAPGNAWVVSTNRRGRLRWHSGDDKRIRQPARSVGQRIADFFYRLLPIESQL